VKRWLLLAGALALWPSAALATPWAVAFAEPTATPAPPTLDDPVLDDLFVQLKAGGLLDPSEATLEQFEARLQEGQDRYVRGDALGSAVGLYGLTQDPRWDNFLEIETGSSAYYHLGVALRAHGAERTARAAFAQVLSRGPDDPYFTPAVRRTVDLALDAKDPGRGLAMLEQAMQPHTPRGDDVSEVEYLRGRALQAQGNIDEAHAAYGRVSERSRFYTAATYLQGLMWAERGKFDQAEDAFCTVVGGPEQSMSAYYVDHRYFRVRDLAHLGLGRVAHERRRHADAFYHYFQVPQDSDHLPEALFESAWTMAEEGEYAVARGLLAELRTKYPDAPQTVEARVLAATLKLYDCDFREAEADFTAFIDDMAPVADHLDEIGEDPDRVRALHTELDELRAGDLRTRADSPAHRVLLSMLDADPQYARLARKSHVLRKEAAFAGAVQVELDVMVARLADRDTAAARDGADPLDVLDDVTRLERGIAGLERQIRQAEAAGGDEASLAPERAKVAELRGRLRKLRGQAGQLLLDTPPVGSAKTKDLSSALQADAARIERIRLSALATADALDDQAATVAAARLRVLSGHIDDLMGEARMGRIDAVLGAKKKLEIEVRDMAAGKFPSELFGKLEIEGVVGDDEEFWPYEGEYWPDEYEGYR
jgi:TolA-binding protein